MAFLYIGVISPRQCHSTLLPPGPVPLSSAHPDCHFLDPDTRSTAKMYRASQFIKNMTTSNGKQIAIAYVKETDAWTRPFLPQATKDEFVQVAEKYKDTLKPDTVKVAM
ncbi:hypothetical protein BJX96DRAFT_159898, partial [Aspergillus floccosus]